MMLVLLLLFLSQRETLFAHQSWYRHFDPILVRPLVIRAVSTRRRLSLTQWTCDSLPWPQLRLAVARSSAIRRITQQPPHGRPLPTISSGSRRNLTLIQHARDGVDAQPLLRIRLKHHPDDLSFALNDLVISSRTVALSHIPIAVGSARKHIHRSLLRTMAFPPPATLGDLRAFILGDHALELHQQLILRTGPGGRLQNTSSTPQRHSSSAS